MFKRGQVDHIVTPRSWWSGSRGADWRCAERRAWRCTVHRSV